MVTEQESFQQSIVSRGLWSLVRLSLAIPWLTVLAAVALAGGAVWYTATHLGFQTSRNALVPQKARYMKQYRASKEDFGDIDPLIVAIAPQQFERGKQFVDTLAARLRADTQYFARVTEKIATDSLEGKKLLLLAPPDLHTLKQRLEDAQDLITTVTTTPGVVPLLTAINQEISKALVTRVTSTFLGTEPASTPDSEAGPAPALDVSFLTALFTEMTRALATPAPAAFHSPWDSFFLKDSGVLSQTGYLTSENKQFFFVLVEDHPAGSGFVKHAVPLAALRAHLEALRHDFPDVQAGVTGGKALTNDEMLTSQRDNALASVIALTGVATLFIVGFREVWSPLLVVASLTIGLCWTLGFTTLTVGHLNILSITFAPILIGLADNFGVQLVARYGEERSHGRDFRSAMAIATHNTGPGILTAAGTVALAFYAVMLADFPGLAELGFIAGSGVLLGVLASFLLLPALLAVSEPYLPEYPGTWKTIPHDPLRGLRRFPRLTLGLIALLTLAALVLLPMPRFDYNLLNLQARGTESVDWEYRLLEGTDRSSWYATSVASSLDELYRKKAQFAALPTVERVESLAAVLPANQAERLALIKALEPFSRSLPLVRTGDLEPVDVAELGVVLDKIRFKLQRPPTSWDPTKRPSEAALSEARQALIALQERLQAMPSETAQHLLTPWQHALVADFADKLSVLRHNVSPVGPITLEDVPDYLRERFVGKSGRYLLQIYARHNIWERQPMEAFVTQLQAIDADVTGSPIVAFYSIRQMQQGYLRGGLYALVVIVGITLLDFRRLKPTLLTFLPLGLGALWVAPWMGFLGMQFNMANLVVFPLFMGMAIDCGVHLVHRALETPDTAASPLASSTGKAVFVSGLTTMVGFGSLLVAKHAGIFSLGLLLTLAIGCNLAAAFVVLPLVLHLLPAGPSPAVVVFPGEPGEKTNA
jgi:hopanoid biosynthesis associated RND transporter like protein HpnN